MQRSALALCLSTLLLLAGCASSGHTGGKLRVTLVDHAGGRRFELVNESHTSSVEYYSQPRRDAARKIVSDRLLGALLSELNGRGFSDHAQPGAAPSGNASGRVTRSLEVDRGERIDHWSVGSGTDVEERLEFMGCSSAMLEMYNLAQSYQTIDNSGGGAILHGSSPR